MILDRLVGIFGLLFAAAIAARIWFVSKMIGRSPLVLHGLDSAHDYAHAVLAAIILLEGVNIVCFRLQAYVPGMAVYPYLLPIEALQSRALEGAGLVLSFVGLSWAVIAQVQMGRNWRIGNDAQGKTDIVRRGLYRVSRHPIYLGFSAIAIGLFLATPNFVTLLCAVMTPVILSIIARIEETFQLSRHGEAYRDYISRTRRWL